jgi:hypothetical protein
MEAVASSFTSTSAVIDIGSDNAKICSSGDDVEGRNYNAEYSNGVKDGEDDCRITSIFPDMGKNLDTNSRISDRNANSTNISDANIEDLGNSESSKNTHVKNSVSVKNDNDYHSDNSKNINNLNETNVNRSSNLNENTSSVIGSSGISTNVSASNKRISKRCIEIVQRSKAVPNSNIDSFDFDKEVIELRGLNKVYIHTYMYIYIYIHIHINICIYIYIYIHNMHIYAYTNLYKYRFV